MPERNLYLAAYDVSSSTRLRLALKCAKQYAVGGQKSVHEVFLTGAEQKEFVSSMRSVLDLDEDRFALIRLDPRGKVYTLGKAVKPQDPRYFYVG